MTAKNNIPKIIHQIWIGDKTKMPTSYMDTWKMKGWEYHLWDEEAISKIKLKNKKLFDFFYKKKNWHGASDVVRAEILEKFGGIYIDADTERLASINNAPFMKCAFFSVEANKPNGVPAGMQRIANGVIGTVAGHRIMKEYIRQMGLAKIPTEVLPPWSTIGGTLFTNVIYAEKDKKDVKILDPHTFYPFDSKGNKSRTSGKSYAQHVWGTTHNIYGKI